MRTFGILLLVAIIIGGVVFAGTLFFRPSPSERIAQTLQKTKIDTAGIDKAIKDSQPLIDRMKAEAERTEKAKQQLQQNLDAFESEMLGGN